MSRDGDFNRSSGNPGRRRPVPSPSPLVQAILLAVGATALALLVNGVVLALGDRVEQRLANVSDLYQEFVGHVGKPAREPRQKGGDIEP